MNLLQASLTVLAALLSRSFVSGTPLNSECVTVYDNTKANEAVAKRLSNLSALHECHYWCRREGFAQCSMYQYHSVSGACHLFDEEGANAYKIENQPNWALVELNAKCFDQRLQEENKEKERFKRHDKGEWGAWSDWTPCTVSCGGGQQTRTRKCSVYGGCPYGGSSDVQKCSTQQCATWGPWGDWGQCSASCGGGQQTRTRQCSVYGGCGYGGNTDVQKCNPNPCCTEWTAWSKCSVTCGKGQQTRDRRCSVPGNTYQSKPEKQTQECQGYVPVCASWSEWGPWSPCSTTCGGGEQSRNRTCQPPGTAPDACPGNPTETTQCSPEPCPAWSEWGPWSECSVTCGNGTQTRTRTCSGGSTCPGSATDSQSCDKGPCYTWSSWSEWSECTVLCGGGSRNRSRQCPQEGGCPGLNDDSDICNMMPCPDWGEWSPWSDCTVSCGGGNRSRTRSCPLPKACSPGEDFESDPQPCNPAPCPNWADWGPWSQCSKSCGQGNRKRTRECKGGDGCLGSGDNVEPCFDKPCTLSTEWSQWSPCTATCGGGTQTRSRVKCPAGPPSCPIEEGSQKCNPQPCPNWADWGAWGPCSKTCGGGQRTRTRTCPVTNGCVGQATDIDPQPCNAVGCNAERSVKGKSAQDVGANLTKPSESKPNATASNDKRGPAATKPPPTQATKPPPTQATKPLPTQATTPKPSPSSTNATKAAKPGGKRS